MTRSLLTGACGLALLLLSSGALLAQQQPASQLTPAAKKTPAAATDAPASQPADSGGDQGVGRGAAAGADNSQNNGAATDGSSGTDDNANSGNDAGAGAQDSGAGAQDQGSGAADQAGDDADKLPEPIDFEGGKLAITQQEQYGEKVLAYDGKELAHNYQVDFDKVVKIGGVNVAMVDVGDGGNQCGPAKVLVWKPEGGQIQSETVEQDECGAPPAGVGEDAIYFVPYLLPGDAKQALQWSPQGGLVISGLLSYAPEPGTTWADVDPAKYDNIIDAFHNEAVYKAGQKLLGNDMVDMATSLLVGGGTEKTAAGAFYATGCVPHDCGGNDGFMAVDAKKHALYFARRGDNGRPQSWPPMRTWPNDIRDAYIKAQN